MESSDKLSFELDLTGQVWTIAVSRSEIESLHEPLIRDWVERAVAKGGRYVVFLAGPPGSGKTAIAAVWERLAGRMSTTVPLQALPMDGFHFPNAILRNEKIERLVRGGRSRENALEHYEAVDRRNWERIRARQLQADVVLRVGEGRRLTVESS